jgi:hypothetical protein
MLKSYQMKTVVVFLLVALTLMPTVSSAATSGQKITEAETAEAREIAQQFTDRLLESKDLATIVRDLYVSDFMARYKTRSANRDFQGAPHIYFVPGVDYDYRMLTEAKAEDWQRFYVAANNFIFFGFISVIKNGPENLDRLKSADMYPASVARLLRRNPNLANMIEKQGPGKAISSAQEMRDASATLERANAIMRQSLQGKPAAKIDSKGMVAELKDDDFFQPHLDITDEVFFDFPKGTRLVRIVTPLLFQLTLVRVEGRLKILWTELYVGD